MRGKPAYVARCAVGICASHAGVELKKENQLMVDIMLDSVDSGTTILTSFLWEKMIKHRFISVREKIDHDNQVLATKFHTAAIENRNERYVKLAPNVRLAARYANRHGLITGATGSGKTVTLQTLAEGFSKIGVPVF
jgi:predicted NACHT family NTPase